MVSIQLSFFLKSRISFLTYNASAFSLQYLPAKRIDKNLTKTYVAAQPLSKYNQHLTTLFSGPK